MSVDDKVDGAEQANDGKLGYKITKELGVRLNGETKLSSMFAQIKRLTPSRYVSPHPHYHRRRHYSR